MQIVFCWNISLLQLVFFAEKWTEFSLFLWLENQLKEDNFTAEFSLFSSPKNQLNLVNFLSNQVWAEIGLKIRPIYGQPTSSFSQKSLKWNVSNWFFLQIRYQEDTHTRLLSKFHFNSSNRVLQVAISAQYETMRMFLFSTVKAFPEWNQFPE